MTVKATKIEETFYFVGKPLESFLVTYYKINEDDSFNIGLHLIADISLAKAIETVKKEIGDEYTITANPIPIECQQAIAGYYVYNKRNIHESND